MNWPATVFVILWFLFLPLAVFGPAIVLAHILDRYASLRRSVEKWIAFEGVALLAIWTGTILWAAVLSLLPLVAGKWHP